MKIIPVIFLAAGILVTASCAHLEPALPLTAKLDGQSAVLYGRFVIGDDFSYKSKLALWLDNIETRHPIYIFFDKDEPLYGIRVKPGHYRLVGFAALNRTHQIEGRRVVAAVQKTFSVPAGSEIYLGDFTGEVKVAWEGAVSTWCLKSCTNNFATTTVEFREKYPKLMTGPVVSIFETQEIIP